MPKKLIAVVALFALSVTIGLVSRSHFSNQDGAGLSTQTLFAASFPDAKGKTQALKQWQGKIIVLNFWATWCPPCRDEMPELSVLNTKYQNKNVIVLGIATDDLGLVKEFAEETPLSYPLLAADMAGSDLGATLGNSQDVLPYTVIIKADGSVAKTIFGRLSMPELEKTLNKLI
jgi:thiol-disulfide isomerase/thioredoxin